MLTKVEEVQTFFNPNPNLFISVTFHWSFHPNALKQDITRKTIIIYCHSYITATALYY